MFWSPSFIYFFVANLISSSPSVGLTSLFLRFHIFSNDYIYSYRQYLPQLFPLPPPLRCPLPPLSSSSFFRGHTQILLEKSPVKLEVILATCGENKNPQKVDFGCSKKKKLVLEPMSSDSRFYVLIIIMRGLPSQASSLHAGMSGEGLQVLIVSLFNSFCTIYIKNHPFFWLTNI